MSKSQAVTLVPGETYGNYTLLGVMPHLGGATLRERFYRIRLGCCGEESYIGHGTLLNARRGDGRPKCQRCAMAAKRIPLTVGQVIGPLTIIDVLTPNRIRVRWSCCEQDKVVSSSFLDSVRHDVKQGGRRRCITCERMARGMIAPPPPPPVVAEATWSPAMAWPRPQSLSGARV